jgi:hypothetical protein
LIGISPGATSSRFLADDLCSQKRKLVNLRYRSRAESTARELGGEFKWNPMDQVMYVI